MERLVLAPGVIFDKEKHEYFYRGKFLSGITGVINQKAGYGKMTSSKADILEETRWEGLHVHEQMEDWIESGFTQWSSVHPAATWARDALRESTKTKIIHWQSETLVSDFKIYASAIDILGVNDAGDLEIFDIKRKFNRDYVTAQLSVYKYFVEKYAKLRVASIQCLGTKDKRVYALDPLSEKEVRKLLYAA